jgi:4-carboxymuconolactone decarboxylase
MSAGWRLMSSDDQAEGERQARRLFGEPRYAESRKASPQSARRRLLGLADEVVFGRVYARPGLTLAERSMCTVAALTVLREPVQLRAHLGGALNVGVTAERLEEVITQMAMYAGFPAALNAMAVLDEVIANSETGLSETYGGATDPRRRSDGVSVDLGDSG